MTTLLTCLSSSVREKTWIILLMQLQKWPPFLADCQKVDLLPCFSLHCIWTLNNLLATVVLKLITKCMLHTCLRFGVRKCLVYILYETKPNPQIESCVFFEVR